MCGCAQCTDYRDCEDVSLQYGFTCVTAASGLFSGLQLLVAQLSAALLAVCSSGVVTVPADGGVAPRALSVAPIPHVIAK